MTAIPDIRYARSGDVAIAYQVFGEGPVDLVFVPFFGNIRWSWELPLFVRFAERLASFSRADPLRQARHGPLGPAAHLDARNADGRHPRRARRGRARSARRCSAPSRAASCAHSLPRRIPIVRGRSPSTTRTLRQTTCRRWQSDRARTHASAGARVSTPTRSYARSCRRWPTTTRCGAGSPTPSGSRRARVPRRSSSACWATRTSPTSCRRSGCRRSCSSARGDARRRCA